MKSSASRAEVIVRYWSKFAFCLAVLVFAMSVFGVLFRGFALSGLLLSSGILLGSCAPFWTSKTSIALSCTSGVFSVLSIVLMTKGL